MFTTKVGVSPKLNRQLLVNDLVEVFFVQSCDSDRVFVTVLVVSICAPELLLHNLPALCVCLSIRVWHKQLYFESDNFYMYRQMYFQI
jgi:hypothetical protein